MCNITLLNVWQKIKGMKDIKHEKKGENENGRIKIDVYFGALYSEYTIQYTLYICKYTIYSILIQYTL